MLTVDEHALMLAGYMDAIGRACTTDSVLVNLTIRKITPETDEGSILGEPVVEGAVVDNASQEFQTIVEEVLGLNGRDRLAFYLIDYLCWFKELFGATSYHRIQCRSSEQSYIAQKLHRIEKRGEWVYLSILRVSEKHKTGRGENIGYIYSG